jgi:genome maintenance exonuclease 1
MSISYVKKFTHKPIVLESSLKEVTIDGKRFYETPGGVFPSVTTVVGFEKQKFFAEWRQKNPEESKRVTSRGTKFHSLIEKYLNNEDLDYENLHSGNKALFSILKPELDKINNIISIESPLWSKTLQLAGRTDCIAEYDGKLSVIDFKASTKEKREKDIDNYFAQATAYALMFQERTGIIVDNFAILIACEDGLKQVFQGKPLHYVKHLHGLITNYRESNAVP